MTSPSSVLERPATPPSASLADSGQFARLFDAAVELRAVVGQRARQTEQDRRVSVEVTQLLKEAGLYRVVAVTSWAWRHCAACLLKSVVAVRRQGGATD